MAHGISERDWKLFRRLHEVAPERFCQRTLSELAGAAAPGRGPLTEEELAGFGADTRAAVRAWLGT